VGGFVGGLTGATVGFTGGFLHHPRILRIKPHFPGRGQNIPRPNNPQAFVYGVATTITMISLRNICILGVILAMVQ
jgi:hypothetical protein